MRSDPRFSTGAKPLFYKDDTPEVSDLINQLIELKYYVDRPDPSHLKIGRVNHWPSTGTITIDGEGRYEGNGTAALIALLVERFELHPVPKTPS